MLLEKTWRMRGKICPSHYRLWKDHLSHQLQNKGAPVPSQCLLDNVMEQSQWPQLCPNRLFFLDLPKLSLKKKVKGSDTRQSHLRDIVKGRESICANGFHSTSQEYTWEVGSYSTPSTKELSRVWRTHFSFFNVTPFMLQIWWCRCLTYSRIICTSPKSSKNAANSYLIRLAEMGPEICISTSSPVYSDTLKIWRTAQLKVLSI